MSKLDFEGMKRAADRVSRSMDKEFELVVSKLTPKKSIDLISKLEAQGLSDQELAPLLAVVDSESDRNERILELISRKNKLGEALRQLLSTQ